MRVVLLGSLTKGTWTNLKTPKNRYFEEFQKIRGPSRDPKERDPSHKDPKTGPPSQFVETSKGSLFQNSQNQYHKRLLYH